jgi:type IV pilus assembly protein PilW
MEIVLAHKQTSRLQTGLSQIQSNGRYAIDFLRIDLRRAGYAGCLPGGLAEVTSRLQPAIGAAYSSALIVNNTYEGSFNASTPAANSDSIQVTSALGSGANLTAEMTSETVAVQVAGTSVIKKNSVVVISNCEDGDLFYVTKITDISGAGNFADCAAAGSSCLLQHALGANNQYASLSKRYLTDATVFSLQSRVYSIAVEAGKENSLQVGANKLVESVENMQILYGEDGVDSDLVADYYVPLDDVVAISNVVSLKISLLIRSRDDNLSVNAMQYDFSGGANLTSPDKRLRKVFTTTIALRNKLQ